MPSEMGTKWDAIDALRDTEDHRTVILFVEEKATDGDMNFAVFFNPGRGKQMGAPDGPTMAVSRVLVTLSAIQRWIADEVVTIVAAMEDGR